MKVFHWLDEDQMLKEGDQIWYIFLRSPNYLKLMDSFFLVFQFSINFSKNFLYLYLLLSFQAIVCLFPLVVLYLSHTADVRVPVRRRRLPLPGPFLCNRYALVVEVV